jgi:hypothetical protein
MYEIKKNCEEKFQKYFQEANELREKGLENERIFRFRTICYVLTDMLKEGIHHSMVLPNLIKSVLMSAKPDSVASFLEKLNERAKGEEQNGTFYFVASSNLNLETLGEKAFEINKTKVRFSSFAEAEEEFRISGRFKEWGVFPSTKKQRDFMDYSYFIAEIHAKNPEDAMEKALSEFELFRGLLNFAHHFGILHYSYYGGIPEPKVLSVFEPARVLILFNGKKEHLFDRFSIGFFDYSIKRFNIKRTKFLVHLIEEVNLLQECPLRERCLSAFRKYNNGLDGNVAGTAFLEFWKILELVALSDTEERGMAEAKVASRVASVYQTDFPRDVLNALCNKRNFIAHIGSLQEFSQDEINLIKQYCEGAMLFLLEHANDFKDDTTLGLFYDSIPRNETDLTRLEKAISEVRKLRKQTG